MMGIAETTNKVAIYALWGSPAEAPGMVTVAGLGAIAGLEVGHWLTIITVGGALLYFLGRLVWRTASERQQVMGKLDEIGEDTKSITTSIDAIKEAQTEQDKDVEVLKTKVERSEVRIEKLEDIREL